MFLYNKLRDWRKRDEPMEPEEEGWPAPQDEDTFSLGVKQESKEVSPGGIEGKGVDDQMSAPEEATALSMQKPHVEDNTSENQSDAIQANPSDIAAEGGPTTSVIDESSGSEETFVIVGEVEQSTDSSSPVETVIGKEVDVHGG